MSDADTVDLEALEMVAGELDDQSDVQRWLVVCRAIAELRRLRAENERLAAATRRWMQLAAAADVGARAMSDADPVDLEALEMVAGELDNQSDVKRWLVVCRAMAELRRLRAENERLAAATRRWMQLADERAMEVAHMTIELKRASHPRSEDRET